MKYIHVFKDKDGNKLLADWGEPDIEQTARINGFAEGWTCEKMVVEDYTKKYPSPHADPKFGERLPDHPREQIEKLKIQHETLIEILEEVAEKGIQLKKGDLKAMIAVKTGGAK